MNAPGLFYLWLDFTYFCLIGTAEEERYMKCMTILTALTIVFAANAFATDTITGKLIEDNTVQGFGEGFKVLSTDSGNVSAIYLLDIPGNTCGRAFTVFQLRDNVGATVELSGELEENTAQTSCGILTEKFGFSLRGDGNALKILEPAPAPSPAQVD